MISSFNDFISFAMMVIIVLVIVVSFVRLFIKHRISKQIQEENEYYKEW
jgi:uncharacterized membrane protein YjfL (UPF0719 family)